MLEPQHLPDDLQACQQMLLELSAAHERLQQIYEELLATCTSMQDSQQKLEQEKDELEQTIKELMNRLYGRRSERHEVLSRSTRLGFWRRGCRRGRARRDGRRRVCRRAREEEATPQEEETRRTVPGPFGATHRADRTDLPDGIRPEDCEQIGVDIVEILEFDRPRLWVRRIEYPKYKIPSQPELNIVQGERVPSLIPGGSFGFGIAAEVLFNKFALHVPLYRQQDPFAQLGWAPNRSTLCQIVINSAELLRPLAMLETERVLSSLVINTDDTEVTLLTPGEGKGSRKARLWIYRSNEEHARYNAFAFTNSRARAGPDEFLQDFQGTICGDCYSGYVNIEDVTDGRIAFSACNAHARRYVFNAREQCAEVSSEILALYHLLYDIEERASRLDPVARLLLRRRESVPLMKRMEVVINSPPP